MSIPAELFQSIDSLTAALLLPLSFWALLSGLDDLVVDLTAALGRRRIGRPPSQKELRLRSELRTAIFVPCWRESAVIGRMIESNLQRIRYSNYDVFVGAYPNDPETMNVIEALELRFPNVHLAVCPHPGPTSKADCLNWVYQRLIQREQQTGCRYEVIVTHDAEDLIHADSLLLLNWHMADYDMVQVPVLPLPTPITHWTHGVYCDEFAEYQSRDMVARQFMGAFVPSSGVGTAFRRAALESLAASESNRIFEPVCLTEDYENGLRFGLARHKQAFLPLSLFGVTTREYFPQTLRTAIRQRTRWVTGIALQTWGRHGWRGAAAYKYWLWRDRKGVVGNPASLLMNTAFAYGLLSWAFARSAGTAWHLQSCVQGFGPLLAGTAAIGAYRILYRALCTHRHFGWKMAVTSPVRVVVANVINSAAALQALINFTLAKIYREPLRWVKTEHQYPSLAALDCDRGSLRDVLVMNNWISEPELARALESKPPGTRLGEHLVSVGAITEEGLYCALSLLHSLPHREIEPAEVRTGVARSIPAPVARKWKVLPVQVRDGSLILGGTEPPSPEMETALRPYTRLEIRFHLITPANYHRLLEALW